MINNFDPKPIKYPYPEYTDEHYLKIKKNNHLIFDDSYPYIDESNSFRFKRIWVRILLKRIVFPLCRIVLGLKINNRSILRIYKNELKEGAISISNHIHLWDYISIMKSIRPIWPRVLVWPNNVRGENSTLVRLVGGIPIPDNIKGANKYNEAVAHYLNSNGWLHIYAEGSMWEYYKPIRPFKLGAASLAVKYHKPIVPFGFSYRKPSFIRKLFFHQLAALNLNIGEPIYPNEDLPIGSQITDLTKRAHKAVCELSGQDEENNIYPPIFNKNHKINYY